MAGQENRHPEDSSPKNQTWATGSSHGPHATGVATTHAARVPAFSNLSDDSSLGVHRTALPIQTI
jgi:hypothetical protein